MGFLGDIGGAIMTPLYYAVSGILLVWHRIFSSFLPETSGWSWVLAIIGLTVTIRTLLIPLFVKQIKSSRNMQLIQPKVKELQKKYGHDRERLAQETMKLYKDYGVNPLGGCLPLFLQFPIFIGLYSVLEVAAELRGQSFWWVRDLAAADTQGHFMGFPINPLPIIMGLTMVAQMKFTPQPATVDKTQQRIFMLMPLFFLWISYDFAAALALYWSTQNIFSIFQTRVMKLYMPEPKLEKAVQKPAAKAAPAQNPFFNSGAPSKDKKSKGPKPPRLGG